MQVPDLFLYDLLRMAFFGRLALEPNLFQRLGKEMWNGC